MGAAGGEGTERSLPQRRNACHAAHASPSAVAQPSPALRGASERGWSAARGQQQAADPGTGCRDANPGRSPAAHRPQLQRSVSSSQQVGSWVVVGQPPEGASHFTRTLAGVTGGYVEAAPLQERHPPQRPLSPSKLPWVHLLSAMPAAAGLDVVTAVPSTRAGAAHYQLNFEARATGRCCAGSDVNSPGACDSKGSGRDRRAGAGPEAGNGNAATAFRVVLAWEELGEGRWRATALQAECSAEGEGPGLWVVVLLEGCGPVPWEGGRQGAWLHGGGGGGCDMPPLPPVTTVELASARDSSLAAGCWVSMSVEVRKGEFVSVRRPDTGATLFSLLPCGPGSQVVATAAMGVLHGGSPDGMLPRAAHTGVWPDGSVVVPLGGPVGLGVAAGARLDFRNWRAAPLAGGDNAQAAGQQQRNGQTVAHGASSGASGPQTQGQGALPEPLPGSPAAAREAFRGVSAPAATAAAISATAAATFRWSRTPYVGDADPHLVEIIMADIVHPGDYARAPITYDDIASLDRAKQLLHEAVALPLLLPELFVGIREPWRGVLLFGPPGTGKTLLARAVACASEVTFFAPSSASLTSKWRGDSEKLVRTLFAVARHHAPSIIFLDEVDALGASRDGDGGEGDAGRRFKAELLQQMDGLVSGMPTSSASRAGAVGGAHVMVLAATNCPWDLDGALRRRMEKRIHVPLPDVDARVQLFAIHTRGLALGHDVDLTALAAATEGYSGADVKAVCREAAMAPLRRLLAGKSAADIRRLRGALVGRGEGPGVPGAGGSGALSGASGAAEQQLVVYSEDFEDALAHTQPSVSRAQVARYEAWDDEFCAT